MDTYFIHYTFMKGARAGDGNVDLETNVPINSIARIREIEFILKEDNGFDSVVITNYHKFD